MASHLMNAYARFNIEAVRGEGCYLFDENGKRYLDFLSGVAVNAFGHCHPVLVEALCRQAKILWHSSNLLHIREQERLADRICATSFAEAVFFTNSGSEAVDFSLKLVRRYFKSIGQPERWRVVTFADAFHGRSMAAIAAGGQPKLTEGFEPVVTGFDNAPFDDLDHLAALIGPETGAVMLEPVQGEGGIRVFEADVLKSIRRICDRHGILLVLDEVQTGFGRTGKLFAHDWAGVRPDIVAAAKGIGAGYPLGAVLASDRVGASIAPGSHGSTIGGAPLAVAVGNAVLDLLLADGFLDDAAGRPGTVSRAGEQLQDMLREIVQEFPDILEDVRGLGLLVGLKCRVENRYLMSAMRELGLLTAPAGQNVIRILPPLNVAQKQIEDAGAIIRRVCTDLRVQEQNGALSVVR